MGAPAVRAQAERFVLGQSAPFTGPAAQLGIQFNRGARLWFEQVNAQGGVARRDIELVHLDDGYEPDRCVDNTRKLLANGQNYGGSAVSFAASDHVASTFVELSMLTGDGRVRI